MKDKTKSRKGKWKRKSFVTAGETQLASKGYFLQDHSQLHNDIPIEVKEVKEEQRVVWDVMLDRFICCITIKNCYKRIFL